MSVGGTAGELTMAAILSTALEFTNDRRVLVSIANLVLSDTTVPLAYEADKPLMKEHRAKMLRSCAYPSNVDVEDILLWLELLKGKELPFTPYDTMYVDGLIRTHNAVLRLRVSRTDGTNDE